MIEPSETEQADATRRRSRELQEVDSVYELTDGVICPIEDGSISRWYFPLAAAAIVRDLADVGASGIDATLPFVAKWGLMGYAELVAVAPQPAGTLAPTLPSGDPALWLWAHARNFAVALGIRKHAGKPSLGAYLESIRRPVASRPLLDANRLLREQAFDDLALMKDELFRVGEMRKHSIGFTFARGHQISSCTFPRRDGSAHIANSLIAEIVNPHLRGVYEQIAVRDDLVWERHFDAPLSAAYRHLAEVVLTDRSRECDFCGSFFTVTHGRQRFCPSEPWKPPGGESTCAISYRSRKHRRKPVKEQATRKGER